MKRLLMFGVLCAGLLLSGCASLRAKDHVFRNTDGSLNVPKILAYAEDGIQADCQVGQTSIAKEICTFGLPGVQAAEAFVAQNPQAGAASVAQLLTALEAKVPQVSPYVDFAIALLNGVSK